MDILRGKWARGVAQVVSLSIALQPVLVSLSWADDAGKSPWEERPGDIYTFESAAGEAQSDGESGIPGGFDELQGDFGQDDSGNSLGPSDAENIFTSEHDDGLPTGDEIKNSGGSEESATQIGSETARQMDAQSAGEMSPAAAAFGVGKDSAYNRTKPDLSNDPALQASYKIYEAIDNPALAGDLCSDNNSMEGGDAHTCLRETSKGQACDIEHNYVAGLIEYISGPMNIEESTPGKVKIWLGKKGNNYYSDKGKGCHIYEEDIQFRVLRPEAITSAKLGYTEYDDHMQVYFKKPPSMGSGGVDGTHIAPGNLGGKDLVWQSGHGWDENGWSSGVNSCEGKTSHSLYVGKNVTPYLKNNEPGSKISLNTRTAAGGLGESYIMLEIEYDPTKAINTEGWSPGYCVDQAGGAGKVATCNASPNLDANGCTIINDLTLCESHFPSHVENIPGLSPFCEQATISDESASSSSNACESLAARDDCSFSGSVCIEKDAEGNCVKEEDTYQCGVSESSGFYCDLISHDLPNTFDGCEEEYEVKELEGENVYHIKEEKVCNRVKKLTECYSEREVSIEEDKMERSGSAQCIDSKDFSYQSGKHETTIEAVTDIRLDKSSHTNATITEEPSSDNDWITTVTATGNRSDYEDIESAEVVDTYLTCEDGYSKYTERDDEGNIIYDDDGDRVKGCRKAKKLPSGAYEKDDEGNKIYITGPLVSKNVYGCGHLDSENEIGYGMKGDSGWLLNEDQCHRTYSTCKDSSEPNLEFTLEYEALYLTQSFNDDAPDEGVSSCIRDSDDWTSTEWECLDESAKSLPSPWGGRVVGKDELDGLPFMYVDDPYQSQHTVSDATSDQKGGWCWHGHAEYNPDTDEAEFWLGKGPSYEDIYGNEQQFEQSGVVEDSLSYNTCQTLKDDPQCVKTKETCTDNASGHQGFCYVDTIVYDCGEDVVVDDFEVESTNLCQSDVACMGEDCFDFENETADQADFAKAASLLNAAQQMGQDMSCTGVDEDGVPTGDENVVCEVFAGEASECKIPLGSIAHDCCDNPTEVGLGEYLQAVMAAPKLDSAIMAMEDGGMIKGAYTTLRDPAVSGFQEVTKPFTSAGESISGTFEPVTEAIGSFKDEVISSLNEQMANLFPDLAKEAVTDGAVEGAAQQTFTETIMDSGATQVLQGLSTAYTVYVVTMIAIQMIWECEESEFQLSADRDLKKCKHVGDYCNDKSLFGLCIEKRQAYCCFTTPLSRIVHEQGRPQLGRDWGSSEDPSCGGFTIEEIGQLDWDAIDLSEWIGMLSHEGLMPDPQMTIDSVTGVGNILDGMNGDRANAAERNKKRLDGLDVDGNRSKSYDSMDFPGWDDSAP